MSRAPDHATFVASLRREVCAFDEFIDLLHAEQSSLTKADIEPLADLSRQKADKVEELSALARLRCAFLESHALPVSTQGMQAWMEQHQGTIGAKELSALWERLSSCAAEAQRINRTNGSLINHRMAFNGEALHALSGLTRPQGIYGRDGSTALRVAHRNFGAA